MERGWRQEYLSCLSRAVREKRGYLTSPLPDGHGSDRLPQAELIRLYFNIHA
jgi:hypothetical protein